MSRLPIQSVETATGTTKDIFSALQKGLGVVPNMTRVMANSPAVLQAWAQSNGALGASTLSPALREQIALLTAETNACAYCLSAHSALGKMSGLSESQIHEARNQRASDPRQQAALRFARQLLDQRGDVSEADVRAARSAGFSDAELAEIVAVVALNIFTNFFNRAFDVEVDFPLVQPRGAAAA